jgi:Ribosomal protein L11 methylase
MKYTEVTFVIAPYSETASDLIAALTADVGFDSFVPTPDGVQGYIPSEQYDEPALRQVLEAFPMPETTVSFTASPMEDKDWNEEWERNFFQPIVVDGRAVVHSTFHTDYPKAEYDIVINPQMAFGTGHHQTTRLMMSYILDVDLVGKDVLDMGCGTGILAILACMRGARHADAIDIDQWCADNTRDNIALQHVDSLTCGLVDLIDVLCGDASLLSELGPYDVILANINRNILLADMPTYVARLRPEGHLFISGFYLSDLPLLREKAATLGLRYLSHRSDSSWTSAEFVLSKYGESR